jgi:zinc transport system substrate-binding protein
MRFYRSPVCISCVPLLLLVVSVTGCRKPNVPDSTSAPNSVFQPDVWCTAWPLYSMTRQLVGDEITVDWLAPPAGFAPASRRNWFPSDDQLAAVQSARLLVDHGPGAPYAWWTAMTSLGERKLCNATADFVLADYIPVREMQITHSHGPEGDHSHDYLVPFVWHDPALAAKQVRTIAARLVAEWPDHKSGLFARSDAMQKELASAGEALKAVGRRLMELGPVVLATPDLLFAARGLGLPDAQAKLWAENTGEQEWRERFRMLTGGQGPTGTASLLFAGSVPDGAMQAAKDHPELLLIAIDMLEQGRDGDTAAGRLMEIARSIETACDEAGR